MRRAQALLLHLPHDIAGQLRDQLQRARQLVGGQALARERLQLGQRRRIRSARHDPGGHPLAPGGVGHAGDGGLRDRWVLEPGEVEFVLLQFHGRLWVGTGSDHTDREVEAYGVTVSKQMCEKPVAPQFWAFDDIAAHWDRLVLRSRATIAGKRLLYQEGSVAAMRHPEDLIARYAKGGLNEGTLMFCGTLAVHGGLRPAERFEFELEDPVRGRKIHHAYSVVSFPNLG